METLEVYEITFADKFFDLINAGIKTTTVRNGVREYKNCLYYAYNPDKTYHTIIKITGTAITKFGSLTDDVAKTDGFNNVDELKQELLSFYPDLTDDSPVTIVHFEK